MTVKKIKTVPKKPMSEKQFQQFLLEAFRDDPNINLFRRNVGGMTGAGGKYVQFGEPGMSDIWGIVHEHRCPLCNRLLEGTHLELELKTETGQLTDEQERWLRFVAKKNGIAMVLRPVASDPVGLRQRVCRLIERMKCSQCVEKQRKP